MLKRRHLSVREVIIQGGRTISWRRPAALLPILDFMEKRTDFLLSNAFFSARAWVSSPQTQTLKPKPSKSMILWHNRFSSAVSWLMTSMPIRCSSE